MTLDEKQQEEGSEIMGERNYVVYMPTSLGKGVIIAVFVSKIAAKEFVTNVAGKYAIAEVDVNGDTSIRRYMDLIKEELK